MIQTCQLSVPLAPESFRLPATSALRSESEYVLESIASPESTDNGTYNMMVHGLLDARNFGGGFKTYFVILVRKQCSDLVSQVKSTHERRQNVGCGIHRPLDAISKPWDADSIVEWYPSIRT